MKVTVTGGSGMIGQAFLERVRSRTGSDGLGPLFEVRVLASSISSTEKLRADHPGSEVEELYNAVGEVEPRVLEGTDILLHLGWSTVPSTAKADPLEDLRTNVEGGLGLLLAAVRAGVRRIIFVSSGGTVYGEPLYLPIDERHPVAPRTPYGASKLLFEHYLRCMADLHGFRQVVLRPGNIYGRTTGPNKPQGVIDHWLGSIAAQRTVKVWNGLDVVRDYVHIDDVVEVLIRSLHYEGDEHLFNLGTGSGTSLRELAALMERITGRSITMDHQGHTRPELITNVLSSGLLMKEMGVKAFIPLEEGIARTAAGMLRAG